MVKTSKHIYNKYGREELAQAIEAVKNGMSCAQAARQFSIPRKTLSDHVSGRSTLTRRAGRLRNIPEEVENAIVTKVIAAANAGFPLTKQQFLLKIGSVVAKLGLKTQFKDGIPGKDYWLQLKQRRPDLVIRTPENCGSNRLKMMTREVVDRYFNDLEQCLNTLQLHDKPSQIWNCDETGLQFSPNAAKVIAPKGVRSLVARCSPSKDSITTLVCVNASGAAMPPLCVVKGKTNRCVHSFAIQDSPQGTIWAFQENGWMNDEIGVQWFSEVFLANCGDARPQLLILDSHHSHEVLEMLELAKAQNIHVMALPPHTTHILQPLDRVVFKPFKTAYRRHCTEFLAQNPTKTINKVTWPGLLSKTWTSTLKPDLIQTSFRATGIHPIDRTQIPSSAFAPGEAYRAATAQAAPTATPTATIDEDMSPTEDPAEEVIIPCITLQDLNDFDFLSMTIDVDGQEMPVDDIVHELPILTQTSTSAPNEEIPVEDEAGSFRANWNETVDQIFDIGGGETRPSTSASGVPARSRAIHTHRLLTSEQALEEKRAAAEKKEKKETEKRERKERALQKKLEKAAKNTK